MTERVLLAALLLLPCRAAAHENFALVAPDSLRAGRTDTLRAAKPDTLARARTDSLRVPDSLHVAGKDSLALADSAAVIDTTRMSTPALVGTLDRNIDSLSVRTRENLHWMDYRFLGDLLSTFSGAYLRNQYSEGQYTQVSFPGADWRAVAVLQNGRPLNDPASGVYNLYGFTTEYADRIEVVTGPRAFLYGTNSSGAAVNLVTKNYNSNKPFTKLDYSEGAYGYAIVDGTFSQNISRKVNLTFGFQHQTTDGRYPNALHDAWNSRLKIRYNVSREFNIIASHLYMSSQTGLDGGINLSRSGTSRAFDQIQASVLNKDSYEKITRHDADLSFVGTFLGDTVNVSSLTIYTSRNLREYRDEENRSTPNGVYISSDHVSSWTGALFTQNIDAAFQRLSLGGSVEVRQIEGSPNLGRIRHSTGAAWGTEELLLGDRITVAGFGRFESALQKQYVGAGVDAHVKLSDEITLFGGASTSRRLPNYQELYWTDSTVIRTGEITAETHKVVEAGVIFYPGEGGAIRLAYEHRTVASPIIFSASTGTGSPFVGVSIANGPDVITHAATLQATLRFWYLAVEGNATYILQSSGGSTLDETPKLSGTGGIYFWHKLLHDRLELKAGVKGRFSFGHAGMLFNPEMVAYVPNSGTPLGTTSNVDFFLIAKLGDAYIHLMWENLTDVKYFGTPYYAGGERAVRFGLAWEFLN
jgi:outer membrane cobalamin receptor